jgi:hypothetical protein
MKPSVLIAVAVGVGAGILLLTTSGDYGLTIDEPVYVAGVDDVGQWFAGLHGAPGFFASFRDEELQKRWFFARTHNYNLPVPVIVSAIGRAITKRWIGPLRSYRVGHCLLLAATVGFLFGCLAQSHGWEMAAVSKGSLLLMPQVFSHGHLNATDVPSACFWVWTIVAWLRSESNWRWRLVAALACGLGLATKATFVMMPGVLGVWMLLARRWSWWRSLLVVLAGAPVVMLVFCPMWWPAPVSRPLEFFRSAFGGGLDFRVELFYFGQTYITGRTPIPWHSAFVLPVVTAPPWTLALAVVAVVRWMRNRTAEIGLWLLGAALLPGLRLLPNAPIYDGVRHLMPSLFCLAVLAGFGFVGLMEALRLDPAVRLRCHVRRGLIALLVAVNAAEIARMHPHEMSYYSELIGGLNGAERLGFEVSYWFDAYTPDAVREVQDRLPRGARVWTFPHYYGYPVLRRWGLWRDDLVDADIGTADYLILYTNKSRFYAIDGINRIYTLDRPVWSLQCQGVQLVGLYKLR